MINYLDFEKPILELEKKLQDLREISSSGKVDFSQEIKVLEQKISKLADEVFTKLTPWQRVQLSRHPQRPYSLDYINLIFKDFIELHGDRKYFDDLALIGGFAYLDEKPVMIIGQQKGRNTNQKVQRNFGMPKPEGYRKALRLMKLAEKWEIPIVTFVDTPGAYPGIDAEERGQSEAIATNIMEMFGIKVPIITVIIGEGGSGGALAIAVADFVLMQEYSIYSVISPESCASILWSNYSMAEVSANSLKITAHDLKEFKVIDEIVHEPLGGAHRNHVESAGMVKKNIVKYLNESFKFSSEERINKRIQKFRKMGNEFINGLK